ncbi:hypothetical protein FPV67DRAFT_1428229 [Lyophyllum atratum]|nr:hypothetical protein FPV67DRAFT_1428229 [Lyophyllum atratum]
MLSSPQTVKTLLQWCADNDIRIDSRLHIRHEAINRTAVYAGDAYIPPNTTCDSRWFGYLQSLPTAAVPLPLFWRRKCSNDHDFDDGIEGLQWLQGTEVERHFTRRPGHSLAAIDTYYATVAEPLLLRHFETHDYITPTLDGFYYAYTLVSSRAFLVDSYHGLSMVPIADAFNHSQENHVHLETEFDVCFKCGSLQECEHDSEGSTNESPAPLLRQGDVTCSSREKEFDSYYEMVSNAPVSPNEEIFNTYGETLTNAQLLVQYGFVLDVNDNDRLCWDFIEVYTCCTELAKDGILNPLEVEASWSAAIRSVAHHQALGRFADSSLVYLHTDTSNGSLCLDADGRISHQLWILLAIPFCQERLPEPLGNMTAKLGALLESQLALENMIEAGGDQQGDHQRFTRDVRSLVGLARSLISLCLLRKSRLGENASGSRDLNDILDTLPPEMGRTRDALTIAIGEQSILDSCISSWEDIMLLLPS